MRLFEKAFMLPFRYDIYSGMAFDFKDELALQFSYDIPDEKQQELFKMIAGTIPPKAMEISVKSDMISIAGIEDAITIRGWGYLTNSLKLSEEQACEIQDDLANYIVERLTLKV